MQNFENKDIKSIENKSADNDKSFAPNFDEYIMGSAASKIGEALDIAPSSLSFHMKELSHAGLVTSHQEGRFVIYAANYTVMNDVLGFLTENCCGGNVCSPVTACCEPTATAE